MFLKCFQVPKPAVLVDEGILIAAAFVELHGHIAVAAAVCSDPAADEASSKERDGKNRPAQKGFIRFHSPSGWKWYLRSLW